MDDQPRIQPRKAEPRLRHDTDLIIQPTWHAINRSYGSKGFLESAYIGHVTANVGNQVNIHVTNMAEAAAIIGLVASIASLVELSAKVVSRLHDFTSKTADIPESFRSLSTRLPLLTATLQCIQSQAEADRFPGNVTKTLKAVVDDTSKQVSDVQSFLSKVLPADGASKLERALKALKSLAKEDQV